MHKDIEIHGDKTTTSNILCNKRNGFYFHAILHLNITNINFKNCNYAITLDPELGYISPLFPPLPGSPSPSNDDYTNDDYTNNIDHGISFNNISIANCSVGVNITGDAIAGI